MGQWGNVAAGKVRFKMLQASGCLPFYIHGHSYIYICIYSQSHILLESGCDVKYPKTDRPGMGSSLGWSFFTHDKSDRLLGDSIN
jgi:hypothetical protein